MTKLVVVFRNFANTPKNDFLQEVSGVMLRQRIQKLLDDLDPRIAELI